MTQQRIIFYLGKGGVGKTALSLATAVRSAELGHKTLVVSTDIAHNLADFLEKPVGSKPTFIAENLWAQEINAFADIEQSWGTSQVELSKNIRENRLGDITAEEIATFPGLDDISNLSNIIQEIKAGDFERVIVDTAATGSTIRMLSLPDSFRWYADYLQRFRDNRLLKVATPLAGMFIKKPAQIQAAFVEKEAEVTYLRAILRDAAICSFRVVAQPQKVAMREAERIISYLSLYDYPIDCLVMNRITHESDQDEFHRSHLQKEAAYLEQWGAEAQPFMLWHVPEYVEELLGIEAFAQVAQTCFGLEDPGDIFTQGLSHEVVDDGNGRFLLRIPMPFMIADDVRLRQRENKLFISLGNFKRELLLPATLHRYAATKAQRSDGVLTIVFDRPTTTDKGNR